MPFTKNRQSQPASCVTSAIKASGQQNSSGKASPTVTVQLIPEVSRCGGTPERGASCVMETESTLNSEEEDDDDDDDYDYDDDDDDDYDDADASTTISNSSSPEIFRKERSGMLTIQCLWFGKEHHEYFHILVTKPQKPIQRSASDAKVK